MGNFEKLSVLVIVVIIVMILVVALYTWTDNPDQGTPAERSATVGPSNMPRGGTGTSGLDDWEKEFGPKGKGSEAEKDIPPIPEPPVPIPQPQPPTPEPQPLPEPEPQPQPAAQEWMYTVKAGDTITEISQRELDTWKRWKEIVTLNPDANPNALRVGQVLKMPPRKAKADPAPKPGEGQTPANGGSNGRGISIAPGEHYVVRSGDRLSTIAKRAYGSIDRWPELWARNLSAIDDPDSPPVGAKIFIPK